MRSFLVPKTTKITHNFPPLYLVPSFYFFPFLSLSFILFFYYFVSFLRFISHYTASAHRGLSSNNSFSDYSVVFLDPPWRILTQYFKLSHGRFIPLTFPSTVYNSPIIRRHTLHVTETVVK